MAASGGVLVYAVIGNIPAEYHSSDLRNYFSQFIEGKGFHCFHFRHRPERKPDEKPIESDIRATTTTSADQREDQNENGKSRKTAKTTTCCVVHLKESKLKELIQMYHKKHWLDSKGESIASLCFISKIKVSDQMIGYDDQTLSTDSQTQVYKTRREQKKIPAEREEFTSEDLNKLAELHPPDIMPNGNVGTPTMIFLDLIQQCRLPPAVIKKLGLSFPKTRTNKKYGSVPFNYGGVVESGSADDEEVVVKTGDGKEIIAANQVITERTPGESEEVTGSASKSGSRRQSKSERKKTKQLMAQRIEETLIESERGDKSEEDNDSCEEWERHEALYDDPTNQERNKERLFEEEIELKWEKGGSGLVFYTDAQYWDAKEGDFDEKTADDWDVDMSVYYDPTAGDMDARESVRIRQEQRRREGTEGTDSLTTGIGQFDRHTRGFGRRIMNRQGWREGQGLGSTVTGMSEALENEGQNPKDRKGFGYRGEKLVRHTGTKRRAHKDVMISTIYDDPSETDPTEPLLRRHEPYGLKYRKPITFTKASQPDTDPAS